MIILEGVAEYVTDLDAAFSKRLDEVSRAKYQMPHGVPFWMLRPQVVFAWSMSLENATRWVFGDE